MIESLKDYESILENVDLSVRRKAVTETASSDVWHDILARRPELAGDVALNKRLPIAILDFLIENSSVRVRCTIAMKHGLDPQHFERLGTDYDESVRIMVANNNRTPLSVLKKLTHDSCERVSNAACIQIHDRKKTKQGDNHI